MSQQASRGYLQECRGIVIHGPSEIQNQLVAGFLGDRITLPVSIDTEGTLDPGTRKIILRDCIDLDSDGVWQIVNRKENGAPGESEEILFNVPVGIGIEQEALEAGFLGVFYRTDSIAVLSKGLRAILEGDIWFSRNVLMKSLQSRTPREKRFENAGGLGRLTPREVEILGFLALGATNEMIAEKFCISVATVKTHLYRIYKKISANNRLQAVLWATQNM